MVNEIWEDIYKTRQTSAEQAILHIKSSQKVFLGLYCNEPQTLVEELVRQKDRLQDILLFNGVIGSPCLYADVSCHDHFKIQTFLSSPLLKNAFANHVCDYLPVNLSQMSRWLNQQTIDVALIQVTPPNEQGYCNLGVSVDCMQTLIKRASIVVAEVNSQLPHTYGDTLVHVSEIDQFVPSSRPLLTLSRGKLNEEELTIGRYVAELIPNYATIQVGLGKIADSILLSLKSKQGLGIHSGSITDSVIELINLGVITNEHKEINPLKTICTTLTGTDELYQFCHNNPSIELYPSEYTHNAANIAKLSQFYSINSALEVDLFGQVNAEQVSQYPMAGVGGQMDFILGAKLSNGGRSIIALPSTAKKCTESRIKMTIPYVTSVKTEIDYVVTEYGIADLFGKSLRERAKELISIAHPDFRGELYREFERSISLYL